MNDDIRRLYATLSPKDRATVDATIHELFLARMRERKQAGGQKEAEDYT